MCSVMRLALFALVLAACSVRPWRPAGIPTSTLRVQGTLSREQKLCVDARVPEQARGGAARMEAALSWKTETSSDLPLFRLIISEVGEQKTQKTHAVFFEKSRGRPVGLPLRLKPTTTKLEFCFFATGPGEVTLIPGDLFLFFGDPTPSFLRSRGFEFQRLDVLSDMRQQLLDALGTDVKISRDCDGQNCAVPVEFEQLSLRFPIGTAVNSKRLLGGDSDSERYREILLKWFTGATLENDLKMLAWQGVWTDYPRERALQALSWLKDHGFEIRGHTLYWGSWQHVPEKWKALSNSELESRILQHVKDVLKATAPFISEWDLINEPFRHRTVSEKLGTEFLKRLVMTAREATSVPLYVNDFSNIEALVPSNPHFSYLLNFIRGLRGADLPVGGVGLQGHFSGLPLPDLAEVKRKLDVAAALGLPVRITELDIDVDDDVLQAEYLGELLRLFYYHPAVQGITLWGFWEGHHWRPHAGLWRMDWSEKPAAHALMSFHSEALLRGTLPGDISQTRLLPGQYRLKIADRVWDVEIAEGENEIELQ